ncbi:hypothetical protein DER44DRAFT_879520 [Fusarium oxysporum]|nr:hypothetical protein DER44DRAFT_879520 [Fusarium oxysporum]
MAPDPLRLDDFLFRVFYEKGYNTWSSLLKQASEDPRISPASLQVEHLFPQHPYFLIGIELDTTGLLTATSTWVPGTGSCDLPPFEQPFRLLPCVATPTRLFTSTKLPLPPYVWFKQSDNHLTVLLLAWAYALSARWAEIFSQASPLEYTGSQAEWLATLPCDSTEAIVDVGNVSDDVARCASRSKATSHQRCPSFETAVQYISDYRTLHSAHDQNRAAFATALMLPLANYDRISVLLPVPRMCTAPSRIRSSTESTEEPIYGRDIRQFDRLLTLSCNPHGVKSILGSIFYDPGVLCNTYGPWLQGTATVLQSIRNLDILARTFSLRSPHLSFSWLGAMIAGLHRGFLRSPGLLGLLGLNRIDIHEAAWTGTLASFIQDHVPQQPENTTSISCRHEFTLAFLTQGIARYKFPPIYPYRPLGSTAVKGLDLDVRLHKACQGGHGLESSKITWTCAGRKNEVQEAAALTTIIRPPLKSSHPGAASLIDYRGLDPDKDISEQVTRNVLMWMREMDGFPINEREIYKHEWFDDGDSDDDDRNCAEGDGGSTMGCDLSVTVGGWLSGVIIARLLTLGVNDFRWKFNLRMADTIHDSYEWIDLHTCASPRCMAEGRRIPFFHNDCFCFRLYDNSDALVAAGDYAFDPPAYERKRRSHRINCFLAPKLRDELQIRLPAETLMAIAGLLVREYAIITAKEQTLAVNISDITINLTQDIYISYTTVDGVQYVKSIGNTLSKFCNEDHPGLLSKQGERVGKIWIAEDYRGIRPVKFCPAEASLAGPTPIVKSWWRHIFTPCDVFNITIKSDDLKLRDILICNETIPDDTGNYVGWANPEHPNDVIDITTFDRVNSFAERLWMTFFNCNVNGITGYTAVTGGSSVAMIHAHENDSTRFYTDMDAAYPRGFFIHMPLDDGEFVTEICRRYSLAAGNRVSACLVIWFNDWTSVHPKLLRYLAFDGLTPPVRRPSPHLYQTLRTSGPRTPSHAYDHRPITGILLEYENGHRECLGQFRFDKALKQMRVEHTTDLYIGSLRTTCSYLYVADIATCPPHGYGGLAWMRVSRHGTLEWWSSLRHSIVRYTSTTGQFTNVET